MSTPPLSTAALHPAGTIPPQVDPRVGMGSGVSWGAILAGAAGAAALSLILLILGTGLGLSSVSPWVGRGAGATALGLSTIAWLSFTQVAASGMGGYLAGRLRTKWAAVHADEVYFRDTAHGFLAWAIATLVTAAVLTSAIGAILGTGAQAGATLAGGAATAATAGVAGTAATATSPADAAQRATMGMDYHVDTLFRRAAGPAVGSGSPAAPTTDAAAPAAPAAVPATAPGTVQSAAPVAEVARIFANNLRADALPAEDARYVGQLVAQHAGIPQAEAEQRVAATFTNLKTRMQEAETDARAAADTARKASAGAALWLFVSLLVGAFVASLAATFGGRRRDL